MRKDDVGSVESSNFSEAHDFRLTGTSCLILAFTLWELSFRLERHERELRAWPSWRYAASAYPLSIAERSIAPKKVAGLPDHRFGQTTGPVIIPAKTSNS